MQRSAQERHSGPRHGSSLPPSWWISHEPCALWHSQVKLRIDPGLGLPCVLSSQFFQEKTTCMSVFMGCKSYTEARTNDIVRVYVCVFCIFQVCFQALVVIKLSQSQSYEPWSDTVASFRPRFIASFPQSGLEKVLLQQGGVLRLKLPADVWRFGAVQAWALTVCLTHSYSNRFVIARCWIRGKWVNTLETAVHLLLKLLLFKLVLGSSLSLGDWLCGVLYLMPISVSDFLKFKVFLPKICQDVDRLRCDWMRDKAVSEREREIRVSETLFVFKLLSH